MEGLLAVSALDRMRVSPDGPLAPVAGALRSLLEGLLAGIGVRLVGGHYIRIMQFAEPGWFGVVSADTAALGHTVACGGTVHLFALQWWFGFLGGTGFSDGFVAGITLSRGWW